MKNSIVVTIGMYAVAVLAAFFAVSHPHGSIVMRSGAEAHINIGMSDGIHVGDTLMVWREQPSINAKQHVAVGTVKVTKVWDAHYAAVQVVTGAPQEKDAMCKETSVKG